MGIFTPPKVIRDMYGRSTVNKSTEEFNHLIGLRPDDIILFDNGTDELAEQGRIILPRHYFVFVGTKNGDPQFKPYEYNQYRIVVSTYNNIITSIDSIG